MEKFKLHHIIIPSGIFEIRSLFEDDFDKTCKLHREGKLKRRVYLLEKNAERQINSKTS